MTLWAKTSSSKWHLPCHGRQQGRCGGEQKNTRWPHRKGAPADSPAESQPCPASILFPIKETATPHGLLLRLVWMLSMPAPSFHSWQSPVPFYICFPAGDTILQSTECPEGGNGAVVLWPLQSRNRIYNLVQIGHTSCASDGQRQALTRKKRQQENSGWEISILRHWTSALLGKVLTFRALLWKRRLHIVLLYFKGGKKTAYSGRQENSGITIASNSFLDSEKKSVKINKTNARDERKGNQNPKNIHLRILRTEKLHRKQEKISILARLKGSF